MTKLSGCSGSESALISCRLGGRNLAVATQAMPKQENAKTTSKPKKPLEIIETPKRTARSKDRVDTIENVEAKAAKVKPILLKLPKALKKAARACAKAQDLKLRAWIVELIKAQLSQEDNYSVANKKR